MGEPVRILYTFVLSFILIALIYNFLNNKLPKIPGDIYIDKFGFNIYIPFVSAMVLSVIITIFIFNFFKG